MTVLGSGDKSYRREIVKDNREYYDILDKLVDDILTKKMHSLTAGFDYHYISFNGDIKVKKHKLHGMDYLCVSNEGVTFDMNYQQWGEIIIRRNGAVEIETQGGGIFIDFGKVKK